MMKIAPLGLALASAVVSGIVNAENPRVVFETTAGDIHIELYAEQAPVSVENFLSYIDAGFYDGTIFHRIIPGFVIQGGGFDQEMARKDTRDPIVNEADNGVKNTRATLSMARTQVRDSATSQFFVNLADNAFLDHGERDFGYAVFAEVTEGMEVVDQIAAGETTQRNGMADVPVEPIVVRNAYRAEAP
ncbi:MAG: peptidylprolyl isomerase [Spiribacter sp.]|jgi:peptidyl-prolyl cis-trans isomerase A (cyclophilin A)|nr:peptidylprolyl isomerase [Spiribacter sp.]MDR9489608.1 peptidylprolyl isomerase [Spiribacter sp.]